MLYKRLTILIFFLIPLLAVSQHEELEQFLSEIDLYTFDEYTEFPRDIIWDIKEDAYGYIWIATLKNGLYRYDGYQLENFSIDLKNENSYPAASCSQILIAKDSSIWFGYDGGLCTFNYETKSFHGSMNLKEEGFGDYEISVLSIAQWNDTMLLVGTKTGFWIYDMKNFRIKKRYLNHKSEGDNYAIRSIVQQPGDSGIWLSGSKAFYYFDPIHEKIDTFPIELDDVSKFFIRNPNPCLYSNGKFYFLGIGNYSIVSFNPLTKEWKDYGRKTAQVGGASFYLVITNLMQINENELLFNRGVHFEILNTKEDKSFHLDHKAMYDGCGSFLFDKNGHLWIYTNWKLNRSKKPFKIFRKPTNKTLVLNSIKINDKWEEAERYHNEFELKEYEKNLELQLALINPLDTQDIDYEYKINNKAWKKAASNKIFLNNLSGGTYEITARALMDKEVIAEKPILQFKKEKTLLEKPWFWLLTILSLSSLVFFYNRMRVQAVRKEERIKSSYEKKLTELQMEALQSQMNPHFIFNALNSIKHFILTNEKFKAAEYLSSFSSLVRQVLNNSKSHKINLEKEIETLKLYIEMEQMRFDNKFEFDIKVDPNLDLLDLEFPPLIFQPYIENAIWHGLMHKKEMGKLKLAFEKQNGSMLCTIEDNGIGRERAMLVKSKTATNRKSFGMQITKDRMDFSKLNADVQIHDLKDSQDNATGTRVEIRIPIIPQNENNE